MQRLEGANTQWYAIFTLQMCILAVLQILKQRNSFPAGIFCISILVAVYMGLPINVEKYNTGIICNQVDLSADQQELTCCFVFLFYIYNLKKTKTNKQNQTKKPQNKPKHKTLKQISFISVSIFYHPYFLEYVSYQFKDKLLLWSFVTISVKTSINFTKQNLNPTSALTRYIPLHGKPSCCRYFPKIWGKIYSQVCNWKMLANYEQTLEFSLAI